MSCCGPKNLRYCARDSCQKCTVPTYAFPDQPSFEAVRSDALSINGVLSSGEPVMRHQEPFLLLGGTNYAHYGTPFLHLGSQEFLSFTADPLMPLSEAFYFRVHKYPVGGVDVAPDGTVPYQSSGPEVREGDTVFMSAMIGGHVLSQWHPPSAAALPQFVLPQKDTLENWARFGTQSCETMRIISDTYDASLPPNAQPVVRLDGSKAYQFQFTRIGQNLAVLPGATPAPCAVRLSQFMGGPTRLIPLAPVVFYRRDARAEPVAVQNSPPTATNAGGQPASTPPAVAQNAALENEAAAATKAAEETAAMAEEAAAVAEEAAQNGDAATAANAANASNRASEVANGAANVAISVANKTNSANAKNMASAASNAAQRAANAANKAFQNAAAVANASNAQA